MASASGWNAGPFIVLGREGEGQGLGLGLELVD